VNRWWELTAWWRNAAIRPQYWQQASERCPDIVTPAFAKPWTVARWQVLCHKLVDQFLVNARQLDFVFGQPVREMANATNIVPHGGSAVPMAPEVADIRIGAPGQHACFEPSI